MTDAGTFTAPSTHLSLGAGATPIYMVEFTSTVNPRFTTVPEPSGRALFSLGAAAAVISRRRRRATSGGRVWPIPRARELSAGQRAMPQAEGPGERCGGGGVELDDRHWSLARPAWT
jgi:hypothetical protein